MMHTTAMKRSGCFVLCLLLLVALSPSTATASSTITRQLQQQPEQETHADPTSAYALYSLPPFTVTFTSSYSTTGLPTDVTERGQVLSATLHSPLRLITSEFLAETFRMEIAKINPDAPNNDVDAETAALNAILDSFLTLDLQVAVRQAEHLSLTSSGHHDGRSLQDLPAALAASSSTESLLQFEADFFTTAAFLEPPQEGVLKPSNQNVAELLGGWMKQAFEQDHDIYKADLINSEVGVLQHLQQVHIQTDSGAVFDPYTTGKVPAPPVEESTTPPAHDSPIGAWSPSEKLFFTLLVMISILSIAGLLWALKKFRGRNKELDRMMQLEAAHAHIGPGGVHEFSDDPRSLSIGGRHSDEIMEVLNASDRYLAAHRPDLLEAMQQHSTTNSGLVIPLANNSEASNRPVERRYVTATNPFSYLYGASYFHSEKKAVEKDRKRQRKSDPMDGVELQHESVPDDEDLDDLNGEVNDHAVSGFLQTWFQQLVGSRAGTAADESSGLVHSDMDDLVIEECVTQDTMACEEDPSQYEFPYQDFPRQDGTPCLIYEETLNEEEEEAYLRNSRRESLHSTTSYGVHDPMTDDEFQRALSQHNLFEYQSNSNSFERDASGDSVVDMQEGDDHVELMGGQEDNAEADPSKFTNKLERLVAMRHRHYEKQQIVEKHREQRRLERARQRAEKQQAQQAEMQKRDRLLQRHSLELDIQELEAAVSAGSSNHGPPSTASKVITPTEQQGRSPGHQQQNSLDLRQLQKPNLHRRTSSEADLGVSPSAAASAASGIQTNRAMDLEEGSVYNPSAVSTRSDPAKRLVQSARKPRAPGRNIYNDVFRAIDRASPLSTSSYASNTSRPKRSVETAPIVSPASSMTDTPTSTTTTSSTGDNSRSSNRSTPPLMGSGSLRDGSSARKKRSISSASAALAKGFHARRSMSFGNLEEKKMEDDSLPTAGSDNSSKQRLPPQHRRTHSVNRHRRSNSGSPAQLELHGIYAQFV